MYKAFSSFADSLRIVLTLAIHVATAVRSVARISSVHDISISLFMVCVFHGGQIPAQFIHDLRDLNRGIAR